MPALPRFRPRLFEVIGEYNAARLRSDVLVGITVGILALPLAIAFAIASGMTPESGIYTAIIAGFIVSALGGSRVQICGPTGAFIVIVYGIVVQYGVANLLICTLMAGFMLLAMGLLRMGTWIRFIPVSVISGFTKGIAVLILLSQVRDFLGLDTGQLPAEFFAQIAVLWQALDTVNWTAVALALACLALIVFWPKAWRVVPAPIVALVAGTAAVALFHLPVETIGSRFGGIPQSLPGFAFPELSVATIRHLIGPAIAIVLVAAPLATHVPLATLSAILVVVAWNMGEWHDFREMRRYTMNYRAILLATFVLTVVFDLTVAVEVGLVMAAIFFITRMSSLTGVTEISPSETSGRVRVYEMFGSLFFGSANKLEPLLARADPADPARVVVLDLQKTINVDTTGLDILEALRRKLAKNGKTLIIVGAGAQPLSLFQRSGFALKLGEQNLCADLTAGMARAQFVVQHVPT